MEDSDDSLIEELATVAVKEGSDSDEMMSDVDEMANNQSKDEERAQTARASSPVNSPPSSPSSASPPSVQPAALQVLEHNPGEVYPIAEEEEEAASPTAPDGVTSLSRRARLNSGRTSSVQLSMLRFKD